MRNCGGKVVAFSRFEINTEQAEEVVNHPSPPLFPLPIKIWEGGKEIDHGSPQEKSPADSCMEGMVFMFSK